MKKLEAVVVSREKIAEDVFALSFESEELAKDITAGQFVNIRVLAGMTPLLRRPFSISRVEKSRLEIVFNIVGVGTRILSEKRPGDTLDLLGPLGVPFRTEGSYTTAIVVAGGLGVAPFPLLTETLTALGKRIETFLGARTKSYVLQRHLSNVHIATDDGSSGFRGTVVQLLDAYLREYPLRNAKVFACGPTPMLKALTAYAEKMEIDCELSLEGDMACGVGLCQGCPVERKNGNKKYALVCTEGPAFNARDIILR